MTWREKPSVDQEDAPVSAKTQNLSFRSSNGELQIIQLLVPSDPSVETLPVEPPLHE